MKTFGTAALCSLALLCFALTASAQQDVITTVAGGGTIANPSPGSVPGIDLLINKPFGVFADPASSSVYIAGFTDAATYVVNSDSGNASFFAGNGTNGFAGDGTAANGAGTELNAPASFAKDSSGNIYIADAHNCVIREVLASTGAITTIAGGSAGHRNGCGFSGNGGPAVNAQMWYPFGLAIDAKDNIYFSEYEPLSGGARAYCDVRKIDASTGIITTIAGNETAFGGNETCGYTGDGSPATNAKLNGPYDLSFDGSGNLYIADTFNHCIRRVDATTQIITTVAGNSTAGYNGDGPATSVMLNLPQGIYADPNGNLFIADFSNGIVRWVSPPTGQLITFGGMAPHYGYSGDGGVATKALFRLPARITQDNAGNFYVSDYNNGLIRRISAFAGISLSTSSLNFKTQSLGTTSASQAVIVSAVGPITISKVAVTAGYGEKDTCTGVTLAARQTCEIDVSFSPTSAGEIDGTLTITSNAFFPVSANTVTLAGNLQAVASFGPISVPGTAVIFDPDNVISAGNYGGIPAVEALSFSAGSGQFFEFSATGLMSTNGPGELPRGPDGYGIDTEGRGTMIVDPVGSISGYKGSGSAFTGVFTNGHPSGSPPANYPYFGLTEPAIFTPVLNQVFYIGDGFTGFYDTSGSPQRFYVPAGATELWLGFPDACGYGPTIGCYWNNVGSFTVSGTLYQGPSSH